MKVTDSVATPQQITMRWLWRFALLFVLCVIALIALFVTWRVRLSNNIVRTLAGIHDAGFPTNLTQVEQQYYPNIPEEENSAAFFQSAFNMLQKANPGRESVLSLPYFQSGKTASYFSPTNLPRIDRLLSSNHAALEILHQTPPTTNCRYPINLSLGLGTLLPHLVTLKDSARLLVLDSVIRAKKGDTTGAMEDLNAAQRLCNTLDHEPILISQLIRIVVQTYIFAGLEYLLNSDQLTDTQLIQLSQAFHDSPGVKHCMAGELCSGIDTFRNVGPTGSGYAFAFNRLTGVFDRDLNFFLQTMSQYLRVDSNFFPAKIDAAKALDKRTSLELSNHYYLVSGLILPSFGPFVTKQCSVNARLNIVQTVFAIERFRLANQNRLPKNLSDLVPVFLPSVPMDPFDGKPLRYKKLAKGYMVYSIGEDRKDDGGVYGPERKTEGAPADITFVIER